MPKMTKISSADMQFIDSLIANLPVKGKSEKTAGIGGRLAGMLGSEGSPAIVTALAALGLGNIGLQGASTIYGGIKDAIKKEMSYNQMFEEFPELNEMPRAQVDKYWGVLADFAPQLTTNPLVAGQFISNMASYGMRCIDHNVIGQLAQISGNINQGSGKTEITKSLSGLGNKAFDNIFNGLVNID